MSVAEAKTAEFVISRVLDAPRELVRMLVPGPVKAAFDEALELFVQMAKLLSRK